MSLDFKLPETHSEHELFMVKALQLALEAYHMAEVPIGCVYVYQGKIIAWGKNRTNELLNGTRHAEFEAIDLLISQGHDLSILRDTTVYVTCEPCIMCAAALKQVYYGCTNDKFGGNGSILNVHQDDDQLFHSYEAEAGLFREQAIILLRMFYVRENEHAPVPRKKANRILKTIIPPINSRQNEP